jgi:CHAD domain-containing protein
MKQSHIREIIDQRVEAIAQHMAKMNDEYDKELIHKLRVEVKTLRAFMRLLVSRDDKDFKFPRKFKRLYDIAGSIRQAQLELDQIHQMDLRLPGYIDALNGQVDKGQEQWKKCYKERILKKLGSKLSGKKYDSLKPPHVMAFVEDQLHTVHELCVMPIVTDDMLHSARKHIKNIIYSIRIIKKEMKDGDEVTKDIPMEALGRLSDMIGDYNDARIMLHRLTEHSCDTDDLSEKQIIQNLLQESTDRLKREKLSIVKQLLQFLNDALISASPA